MLSFPPRSVLLSAGLATLAMACGLFIGLDEPRGVPLPALPPPPPASPDPCVHVGPPQAPAEEDDGPDLAPFWLALRTTYIGQTVNQPDAGVPGLDLDGTCTCTRGPNTAFDGGSSCVPRAKSPPTCDYDGGVDNSVEASFAAYASVFDGNKFLQLINSGRKDVVIYVANYNGKPNDLSVTVGFAAADGIYTPDCDPALQINNDPPGTQRAATGVYSASWRGCDKWHGDQAQFVGDPALPVSNVPKALGRGFVRDGVLVMSGLTEVPVFISESNASVQDPTLVAPLEQVATLHPTDPVRFRMKNAVLAGRLRLSDLAEIAFNTTYEGFYTCQNLATFQGLMSALCTGVDMTDSSSLDHQGKGCTSMSFAFRFDADVADLDRDPHTPPDDSTNPCRALPVPDVNALCPP